MPSRSPSERALIARIAARHRWALETDRSAATASARTGLRSKFETQVLSANPGLRPDEVVRRVDSLVQEHMLRMSLHAARARNRRRRADGQ